MKLKRPLRGGEKGNDVYAVQRALNAWAPVKIPTTKVYGRLTQDRMQAFQADMRIRPASGFMGQHTLNLLTPFFDRYGRWLYQHYNVPDPLPDLGPVVKGGVSLLDMSLTHKTTGIPLFPAIDLAWGAGVGMYAVEPVTVDTKDTSAAPGEALYMTGSSGLRYWYGHLDRDHDVGVSFPQGALLARTVDQPGKDKDHGHVGVNAEALIGKGKQLLYGRDGNGPDYTLGAPTIRTQLEALLL